MKICIFCEYYENGGIEKISNVLKKIFDNKRYESSIVCTICASKIYDKCISISKRKTKNPIYRFIKTTLNIRKYTEDYDVVHLNVHSSIGLWYAFLLNKKKKIIIHAHGTNFDKLKLLKSIVNKMFKLFCKKEYIYIACSKKAGHFCYGKKINFEIIENEICESFYFDLLKRRKLRKIYNMEDEFVIGHIGMFRKQKNHIFLIKVFEEFIKIHPNSKLFLIGTGSEQKKIMDKLIKGNLLEKTIIVDCVKNTNDYYSMFDCFVFPSIYEGDPLCLREALATSLKCFISTTIEIEKRKNLYKLDINEMPSYWAKKIYVNMNYNRKRTKTLNKFEEKINRIYENVFYK